MAVDKVANQSLSMSYPFSSAFAITPDDDNDLEALTRAIYVGGAGDIKVTTESGDEVTFSAHPEGYLLGRIARVHATGTTATNLVGVY